jgi:hypothetical protein
MAVIKALNLALRFVLELCLLVALGYWGFRLDGGWPLRLVAGLGAPLMAGVVWGAFVAPRARRRLAEPWRFALEMVLFGLGAAALWGAGRPALALLLIVIFLPNRLLVTLWGEPAPPSRG